jgi:16S rRNA (uracil1498-N3)-methyltransferase
MSLPVHWVESLSGVRPGEPVEVAGDEAHHAVAVRRLRAGEQVVLTDGRGTLVRGTVIETGKRRLVVQADGMQTVPLPTPSFTVVQALPKGDRGELAVEVLTEVGVATVVPWAAARSVAVWRGERATKSLARWRSTAHEAAKQSRRAWFPDVVDLATTEDVAGLLSAADVAVVLHEAAELPLSGVAVPSTGSVVVVVGPEGGLTDDELAAFAKVGALGVRLGAEVLRTSTAGVAAVSALLARSPRWGPHASA